MQRIYVLYLAWLIALVSTLSALFVGEVMGQTPCTLCWYQRIAMFPLAIILAIASYQKDYLVRQYVIPIALTGAVIALWHSLLFLGVVSESIQPCTQTGPSCSDDGQVIFGFLPLPYLSFLAFTGIIILMMIPTGDKTK